MKNLYTYLLALIATATMFTSCSDILSEDPSRLTSADEYAMNASGDSVYSMFGVLSKLQNVADSYVLLGELRGDLMDITPESDMYLNQINNFNVSSDNKYVNIKDYYDVINNCNYIIQKLDTNVFDMGKKLQIREYAALKSIRAWTYMQLALNFKTVKYYTRPILTVADAQKEIPEIGMEQLADSLIADIEPVKDVPMPNLGSYEGYSFEYSFMPVYFVLGDLHLWKASLLNSTEEYEKAATAYHQLMEKKRVVINGDKDDTGVYKSTSPVSYWVEENKTISKKAKLFWINSFALNGGEVISAITCPTDYGKQYSIDSLNNQHKIIASAVSLANWDRQTYYLNAASNASGDLRKYGSISFSDETNKKAISTFDFSGVTSDNHLIYKYKVYNQNLVVYRASLLYLRYAEAVNRLNKPNLAYAVLKYGLTSTNIGKFVPNREKGETSPKYMEFTDSWYAKNVGIRMRGVGNANADTAFYRMNKMPSLKDSVLFVEDKIQEELALETAFEGNRFHDLMRITMRRIKTGEGTEAYLADKVAAKHTDNKEAIRSKLLTIDNWFVKK